MVKHTKKAWCLQLSDTKPFRLHTQFLNVVFFSEYRGEQDNFRNRIGIGEPHDAPVYADSQAACGGHTALQSGEEVLVHHTGFIVPLTRSSTCFWNR